MVDNRKMTILISKISTLIMIFFVTWILFIFLGHVFIQNELIISMSNSLFILFFVVLTVCVYKVFERARIYFLRRYFPESFHSTSDEIHNLGLRIISILDLNELANVVVNTLADVLQIEKVSLHIYHEPMQAFHVASSYGFSVTEISQMSIRLNNVLIEFANKKNDILCRETIVKSLSWQEASAITHSFVQQRAYYVCPIIYENQIIGLLNMGKKSSHRSLVRKELCALKKFNKQLGLAVHNAITFNKLKEATEDLKGFQSRLLQNAKISALEQLAAGIAHEIHNPLTIISGKAQVLLLKKVRGFDQGRVEEVLRTIVDQTKRAAEITRRLLMFARPEEPERRQKLNIESVLNDTISLVSYQVSLDDIQIVKVIESRVPLIESTLVEMRELFLNLILNAIQAIGKKGVITISLQHIEKDGVLKISIADTGQGITQDELQSIFDPFYSTRSESVGLGLFVCQQIVHRLGGAIKVDSKVGEGTVFIVTLPTMRRNRESTIASMTRVNKKSGEYATNVQIPRKDSAY